MSHQNPLPQQGNPSRPAPSTPEVVERAGAAGAEATARIGAAEAQAAPDGDLDLSGSEEERLRTIATHLQVNRNAVTQRMLASWTEISKGEPWLRIPEPLNQDHLPQLISDLALAGLITPLDARLRRNLVFTSAQHGQHRQEDGFTEHLIFVEYQLLRQSLWDYLRLQDSDPRTSYQAIIRIDAAISIATAAALRGFHRVTLEKRGQWPQGLEAVLDDWPLPAVDPDEPGADPFTTGGAGEVGDPATGEVGDPDRGEVGDPNRREAGEPNRGEAGDPRRRGDRQAVNGNG